MVVSVAERSKKSDDVRPIGAMIAVAAGIWLLTEGLTLGGWWRVLFGFGFVLLGMIRGWYLLHEGK